MASHPHDPIFRLPKADLHLHLDGSLRADTVLEIAAREGIDLASRDEASLRKILSPPLDPPSLERYLKAFDVTCAVMQTHSSIRRVARELVEDCAAENITYLEARFCPTLLTLGGLSVAEVIEAVAEGLEEGERSTGTMARQIICALRHRDLREGVELAEAAVALRGRGVVAFDLAGPEAGFAAAWHEEAFRIARRGGLWTTVHAGEADGPDSIFEALHTLGADRIGHGTTLVNDPALMAWMIDRELPIEVCPTSNVQTGAAASIARHPVRSLLEQGATVVVCTDNRLVSDVTLSHELRAVANAAELTLDETGLLLRRGFSSAFVSLDERRRLLAAFDASFASLGAGS
jgi:adenosine deaminase